MSGNANSGRWHGYLRKRRADDCEQIAVRGLIPRQVYIERQPYSAHLSDSLHCFLAWADDMPSLMVTYTLIARAGSVEAVRYRVALQADDMPHGGRRWWLVCPNTHCERRCASLYRPADERYFCCRHCHDLSYRSAQTSCDRTFKRRTAALLGSG